MYNIEYDCKWEEVFIIVFLLIVISILSSAKTAAVLAF